MNSRSIKALLKKDASLFMSNRFYMLITVIGIIFYIGIYFVLPSKVDERLSLAMYAPVVPPAFSQLTEQEGVDIRFLPDTEALKQSVLDGDYQVGISLPPDIMNIWEAGGKPDIAVYYASTAPPEIKDAIVTLVKELPYAQTGQALNFNTAQEILGPDMLGSQLPLRDRMRPLLAVFILLTEILTLASLISVEIEQGTARALFVTPMRISDLFIAKGTLGVGLAFIQGVLFVVLVGAFDQQPLLILTLLLLGSIMVVGTGFLLAAVSRDIMSVTGWGMLILIVFAIPGFGTVIPGILSDWVKFIPSFYLTDSLSRIINYGASWTDIGTNLLILTVFTAAVVWAGMIALRRRYQ